MTKFEFTVGSDPNYEDLVADIYFGEETAMVVSQEDGFENLRIEILPRENGQPWGFPLAELEAILTTVKDRLGELQKD